MRFSLCNSKIKKGWHANTAFPPPIFKPSQPESWSFQLTYNFYSKAESEGGGKKKDKYLVVSGCSHEVLPDKSEKSRSFLTSVRYSKTIQDWTLWRRFSKALFLVLFLPVKHVCRKKKMSEEVWQESDQLAIVGDGRQPRSPSEVWGVDAHPAKGRLHPESKRR